MSDTIHAALFTGMEPQAAAEIAALGTSRPLVAGQTLFSLGDPADCLYVVEHGRIALTLPVVIGERHQDIVVEERQVGQTVGWSALVPPYRFTLNGTATVDSRVLALPRTALLAYFAAHPEAGRIVITNAATVVGHLLQVFQAMWLREVNRCVDQYVSARKEAAV